MCGIAAYVAGTNGISRPAVEAMTRTIRHRGPDDEGYAFFSRSGAVERFGGPDTPDSAFSSGTAYAPTARLSERQASSPDLVGMGHRRLSILDLSPAGHQPMCDSQRHYWIAYNGEVYNHGEIATELRKLGHRLHTSCDTEVVLAAYAQWGAACLPRFNGMWAFVIYNQVEKRLFASCDRFGIKPLYYWRSPDGGWAFASEIKQFTTLPGWQAEANIERVHDFLAGGTSLDESSFFRGVRRLPGGHSLILDVASGDLQTRSWYDIETISPAPLPDGPTAAAEHFHALLEDSVRLRLRADVKIGSGLSGGLDSSSIVCCASRLLGAADRQDQQAVVTSCSPHAEYDEQDYAGEVVRATQATWHKIFTDYDGLTEKFSDLVWHHDEPFGSSSGYAQWSIFECARANGITVMLDGQGADEYLAGYPEFFPALFQERMQQRHFRQLLEEIQEFRLQQSLSTSELGRRLLSTFLPAGLRRHLRVIAGRDRCNWLRSEQATLPIFRASVRDSSLALLKSTRLPNLLQLADRNSMAHSVETRVPFLDHRLVEFALALPAEWKIRHGQTKRLLRDAMRNDVPGKVIERKDKMGLPTAEAIWLRNDAPRVEKILAEIGARLPKLIHEAKLQKQFRNDAKGGKLAIGSGYWRLLCLGQWLDRFEVHIQ